MRLGARRVIRILQVIALLWGVVGAFVVFTEFCNWLGDLVDGWLE